MPAAAHFVANVEGISETLTIQGKGASLLLVDSPNNSYVASVYSHYIALAKEHIPSKIANALFDFFGALCQRARIHETLFLNSSLFSTDLLPYTYDAPFLCELISSVQIRYPDYPLVIRSLAADLHKEEIALLKKLGFKLIAMREILYTNTQDEALFRTRILKSDFRLLERERGYLSFSPKSEDLEEMLALYNRLYLEKHSKLSPHITINFLVELIEKKEMQFVLYKKEKLLGFAGFVIKRGVMHVPLMGYELKEKEIYRILNSFLLLESKKQSVIFHQSSGAKTFKTIRRAKTSIEYMAVYTKHLPLKRRLGWKLFKWAINLVARPFMRYF